MTSTRIFLLRHGQTEWNRQARYQGHFDSPLTEVGREQAMRVAAYLRPLLAGGGERTQFRVSPLGRAQQTADVVAGVLGVDRSQWTTDAALKECSLGRWQGVLHDAARRQFVDDFAQMEADPWGFRVPGGGESLEDLSLRGMRWLAQLPEEGLVVAVGHEMINRAIRGILAALSHAEILRLTQPNDQVVEWTGQDIRLHSVG